MALRSGLTVLFPVDYRYGWDMVNSKHSSYISKVQMIFEPIVKLSSPECRPWTAMRNMRGAGVAVAERQEEFPMPCSSGYSTTA
eukprot:6344887-Pyramimonas_sp.AAC.1